MNLRNVRKCCSFFIDIKINKFSIITVITEYFSCILLRLTS